VIAGSAQRLPIGQVHGVRMMRRVEPRLHDGPVALAAQDEFTNLKLVELLRPPRKCELRLNYDAMAVGVLVGPDFGVCH